MYKDYKGVFAFHPSNYVLEYLDYTNLRLGDILRKLKLSHRNYLLFVNGLYSVNTRLAKQLYRMTGISSKCWLNLQNKYDEQNKLIDEMRNSNNE